jgi:hypothetical protein
MDATNNVIAFRPKQNPEAELASLWAWARLAERYGHYVVRNADDRAIARNDEGGAYIQTTIGDPFKAGQFRIDWTAPGWRLSAYDNSTGGETLMGAFRTLRDALEAICPTDNAVA